MSSSQTRPPTGRRPGLWVAFVVGMLATPLVALAFALSGFLAVDAAGTPPAWESKVGQSGLETSLARRSQGLAAPSLGDADLLTGMKTYRNACAGCHGDYGQHRSGSGLYPPVPQFNQHPPGLSASQMFVAVKYGIRYTGMGAWMGEITDQEIWQTVAFLSQLNALPPAVNDAWKAKPP